MMSGFIIAMQVGMWFGYVTFGFISDRVGRKRAYVAYLLTAAVLMLAYALTQQPPALLLLGPVVAFFATGYFTGFGAVTAEIYPTEIRATAQDSRTTSGDRERHRALGRRPAGGDQRASAPPSRSRRWPSSAPRSSGAGFPKPAAAPSRSRGTRDADPGPFRRGNGTRSAS